MTEAREPTSVRCEAIDDAWSMARCGLRLGHVGLHEAEKPTDGTIRFMTEAGRRLAAWSAGDRPVPPDDWLGEILAIEAEAAASVRAQMAEKVRALPEVLEVALGYSVVRRTAVLVAILDAATEPSSEPTWPTREDFRRMSSVEVNAFFASIGSDWRVADFPAPSGVPSPRDPAPDVPPA